MRTLRIACVPPRIRVPLTHTFSSSMTTPHIKRNKFLQPPFVEWSFNILLSFFNCFIFNGQTLATLFPDFKSSSSNIYLSDMTSVFSLTMASVVPSVPNVDEASDERLSISFRQFWTRQSSFWARSESLWQLSREATWVLRVARYAWE